MCVRYRLAGIVAAVVLAGVGCGHGQEAHKGGTPATSAPPAAKLDGTYRLDYDGATVTLNGAPKPESNNTFWWAFRSSCRSTECVATGTKLDDNNHQAAFTPAKTTFSISSTVTGSPPVGANCRLSAFLAPKTLNLLAIDLTAPFRSGWVAGAPLVVRCA